MKKLTLVGIGLLALAVFTGCYTQQGAGAKGRDKSAKKGDDHDHGPGPHAGTIIEFGDWHGEFTVDHKAQEATVYILGDDAKTAAPIQVDKLLLSIKTPQFQVDLKAAPQEGDPPGKSSRFVGKDERFGKEQGFEGTLSGVVAGKPYAGDFKEEEPKDPKQK
jgi:predicted small secreted protein